MPKEVKLPATAKLVFAYYDPRILHGNGLALHVRRTKARVYVWRNGLWAIMSAKEANALIAEAKAAQRRHQEEADTEREKQAFIDKLLAMRAKQQASERRDALLASVEEAALRLTLKARTLDERIKINHEKERLEEEIRDGFRASCDDDEDDCCDYREYSFEFELPEAWNIISPNPDHNQLNLCI